MVVFVPSDSYLTAYDDIRRAYRGNWKPIQVFCSTSADTCASWCLLQTCFQEDLIMYEVHVVYTENDIHDALSSQDAFSGHSDGLQIIFLNCGATMNVYDSIEAGEAVTVHILDSHGPVSLDLLTSPKATNLYIWDAGAAQAYIERFFQKVLDERQGGRHTTEKRRKRKPSGKGARGGEEESLSADDDATQLTDGTSGETNPSELISSLLLTSEEKLSYYAVNFKSETPSLFLFSILAQMRVSVDDEVVWYRTIALTDFYFNDLLSSSEYAGHISKLHEVVTVNQRNKVKFRMVSAPNAANTDSTDKHMVGSFHTVQIEKTLDTPFLLLHHWTLWDALRNSAFISRRLRLFEGHILCKQRIFNIFAFLGITQRESSAKWTELPSSRREEIQRLFLTENVINGEPLCSSYHSISKRHGYGFICGATDMVRLLQFILTERAMRSEDEKKSPDGAYSPSTHRKNFFAAIEALQSTSMSVISRLMTRCCSLYTEIVETASSVHQKSVIKSTKTFDYVLLQEEDLPVYYLHPVTLRLLAEYLVHLPVQRRSAKNRPSIFIIGVLDRANDDFLFIGVNNSNATQTDGKGSIETPKRHNNVIPFVFRKLALKYEEIVTHRGIDKDWIRVKREHCLHLLDAIHVDLLGVKRGVV